MHNFSKKRDRFKISQGYKSIKSEFGKNRYGIGVLIIKITESPNIPSRGQENDLKGV